MEAIAPDNTLLAVLRTMAKVGFAYNTIKEIENVAGWELVIDESDLGFVQFTIQLAPTQSSQRLLSVMFESGKPPRALLPLFYFEDYDLGREQFDLAYRFLAARLTETIGYASQSGDYHFPHRQNWPYAYCWWSLSDASLVLVQDELDIQFGMDISLWVLPAGTAFKMPVHDD